MFVASHGNRTDSRSRMWDLSLSRQFVGEENRGSLFGEQSGVEPVANPGHCAVSKSSLLKQT